MRRHAAVASSALLHTPRSSAPAYMQALWHPGMPRLISASLVGVSLFMPVPGPHCPRSGHIRRPHSYFLPHLFFRRVSSGRPEASPLEAILQLRFGWSCFFAFSLSCSRLFRAVLEPRRRDSWRSRLCRDSVWHPRVCDPRGTWFLALTPSLGLPEHSRVHLACAATWAGL